MDMLRSQQTYIHHLLGRLTGSGEVSASISDIADDNTTTSNDTSHAQEVLNQQGTEPEVLDL